MKRAALPLALAWLTLAAGCSTVAVEERPTSRLEAARGALHGGEFATADQILSALAAEEGATAEGHEALFLLGLLHLDPRNPAWSPAEAEIVLGRYLEFPFAEHRPEGVALYALARRLATPQAAAGRVAAPPADGSAVAPPADGSADAPAGGDEAAAGGGSEADRLRAEVAARDRELAKLRDELERIRRRLAPPS